MRKLLLIAVTLTLIGCEGKSGSDSPPILPTPELIKVQGTWAGSYTTNLIGPKDATFILSQNLVTVSGTFQIAEGMGSIKGTATTTEMIWTLQLNIPGCPGNFEGTATVVENKFLTSFNGVGCLGTHTGSGTFTLVD